jgi:hypothetical protein
MKVIEKIIELEPRKVYLVCHIWEDNVGNITGVEIPISNQEYEALKEILKEEDFELAFCGVMFKKIKELQGDC